MTLNKHRNLVGTRIRSECPQYNMSHYCVYYPYGSSRVVSPIVTNGLTQWLEARNSGYTYNDNDRVSNWSDLSSSLHHLQQLTAMNKPLYKTNGGLPYIDFDTTTTTINRLFAGNESITEWVGLSEGTIIFTMEHYNAAQPATPFNFDAASFNRFLSHCSFSDNNIYVDWGNYLGGGRVTFAEPAGWNTGWHTVEFNRNGNAFTCTIDGVIIYNNASAFSIGLVDSMNTFGLGNIAGFGFRLSSLLIWNRSLSAAEQLEARTYVNSFRP